MSNNDISAAAAAMGRKGGSVKSERKAASSAANGAKGGRPAGNKLHAVTVRECTVEGLEQTVRVYAANADDAFARGVHKLYGKATWFKQDSGLLPGYGQIFKPAPECGPMAHRAVTMRVQITVEEVSQSGIAPRMTDLVDIPEPVAIRLRELIVGGTSQHRSRVLHLARNEVRRVLLGHSVSNKRRKLPGGLTMQQIIRTMRDEGLL